jgi:putative transposase
MRVEPCDTLEELRQAVHRASDADERDRLRMVVYAKEGQTGVEIGRSLGCTDRVVRKWIRRYNELGLAGLKDLPRSGRPRHLETVKDEDVRKRLNAGARLEDGVCVLRGTDVRRILEEEFGARYSLSGTYVVLHRLGYSSLMPRPQHPETDPAAQEEFEKNTTGDGAEHRLHASRRQHPDLGAG